LLDLPLASDDPSYQTLAYLPLLLFALLEDLLVDDHFCVLALALLLLQLNSGRKS
jgi:hypothetical protein